MLGINSLNSMSVCNQRHAFATSYNFEEQEMLQQEIKLGTPMYNQDCFFHTSKSVVLLNTKSWHDNQ
jgi:hypothetical protein